MSSVGSEVSQHVFMDRLEHGVSLGKAKILSLENTNFEWGVKVAIYIILAEPSLTNDCRYYFLPAVWTKLLRARILVPPWSQDH